MVGGAACLEAVDGGLQVGHRGDELGILGGGAGEADHADAAAATDLTGGGAAGGLGDQVDEGVRPLLQAGQGGAGHAAGAV